jgi:hypothetical protein
MQEYEVKLSNLEFAHWINVIRQSCEEDKEKLLDSLYWGQMASKGWLINNLKNYIESPVEVYIFGGWIGLLASMLFQSNTSILKITNIDIDAKCFELSKIANKTFYDQKKFLPIIEDMALYQYCKNNYPKIIINTSTEHVDQEIYNKWYTNIPKDSLIVIQGNNMFSMSDHTRCSYSLEEFKKQNLVSNELYSGEIKINKYTRYMSIWRKD